MSEVLTAVRGVWRYLFTGKRLARMGGDLGGSPDSPRITPPAFAAGATFATTVAQNRMFERRNPPPIPLNDARIVFAGRAFAQRRK